MLWGGKNKRLKQERPIEERNWQTPGGDGNSNDGPEGEAHNPAPTQTMPEESRGSGGDLIRREKEQKEKPHA